MANILIYTIAVGVKKIVNKLCATPLPTMPDDKCQNPIMGSTIFTISSFIVILAILLFFILTYTSKFRQDIFVK